MLSSHEIYFYQVFSHDNIIITFFGEISQKSQLFNFEASLAYWHKWTNMFLYFLTTHILVITMRLTLTHIIFL